MDEKQFNILNDEKIEPLKIKTLRNAKIERIGSQLYIEEILEFPYEIKNIDKNIIYANDIKIWICSEYVIVIFRRTKFEKISPLLRLFLIEKNKYYSKYNHNAITENFFIIGGHVLIKSI